MCVWSVLEAVSCRCKHPWSCNWTHSLWGNNNISYPCMLFKFPVLQQFLTAKLSSVLQDISNEHRVFAWDRKMIYCTLTHNSWVYPSRFTASTSSLSAGSNTDEWWDKHTPAATCICTAFLVFNSPQLTVSIVTGWEELKTEKDIQDIWCPSPTLALSHVVLLKMMYGLKSPC